jgi:general secretion pathway protein D
MRVRFWMVGKNPKIFWLAGALGVYLSMGMGCAGPTQTSAPAPPLIRQVPVRVSTSYVKPEAKSLQKKKEQAEKEAYLEEQSLAGYTTRLKKIPKTRRTPPKGEKVYPIDLNLRNADLVEAIRVLAETMGLNYSIDPRVKGTVNVRASGKLSQSELLSIMETLLALNGAALIKGPDLYKIVPADKAASRAVPVYIKGPVPPGMRAQVVFLEQTSAKEMLGVLKPLMSHAGSISEASHNALVLVDTPENLDKLLSLIHLVDTRSLAHTLIRIVKVHNADPGEIIKEMETIFTAYGTLSQKEKGKFGVNFLPVTRLNSIMLLASSNPLMERALYWVRQLDQKTDLLANVHIYNVENYRAKNLADILTQVYGGTAAAPQVKEAKPLTTTGTTQTTGGLGGFGTTTGTMGGTQSTLGSQMGLTGSTLTGTGTQTTGGLGRQMGGAGAGPLKERATPMGGAGVSPKEGVRIIPDEENNLLVVVAPPYEWNIISRLLKELDIMPRQVLNEVLIAEVRLTDQLKYGIEFLLGQTPTTATAATSTTGTTTTGVLVATPTTTGTTSTAPTALSGVEIVSPASAAFSAAGGLTFVATDTLNKLKGLINLLAAEGKVDILASPHIMAANNQEARIQIGSDVPTLTSTSVPLISQTTSFQTSTVQYRSTGIILSVKPQINAKGLVTLEIAQEVSNVDTTTTTVSGSPTFTVRSAKTVLTTADNQTVVLGGLIREDRSHTQAGIPGLRRLPILGPLFGSEGVSKEKTELLVLITPHIVTNMEEGARVTHSMKERIGLEETKPANPPGTPGAAGR